MAELPKHIDILLDDYFVSEFFSKYLKDVFFQYFLLYVVSSQPWDQFELIKRKLFFKVFKATFSRILRFSL